MVQNRMDRGLPMSAGDRFRRILKAGAVLPLLATLIALGACSNSSTSRNCTQPVESRSCPYSEKPTGADLLIQFSDPARFDSVVIRVYSGNVDDGHLEWTIRPASHTTSKRLENIEFGNYSAMASYYKSGVRGDAIDGDEVGTDSDSDGCGCVSYSKEDGALDLVLE